MNHPNREDRTIPFIPLFYTWFPLAVMWILMAVEQPLISAVISRTGDGTKQLAAFGYSFALALFIEGPIIQMLSAGTALSDNRDNYKKLLTFMHIIGWSATGLHLFLALPPVFRILAENVFHLPEELIEPSQRSFMYMLPWTVAVGYRRLWQGLLIRYNKTRVIPVTMVARLGTSIAILFFGYCTRVVTGAPLGGLALTGGTVVGAILAGLFAHPVVKQLSRSSEPGTSKSLSWGYLLAFYIPLALTNFINMGARPLINLGIARGSSPVESLALWPVLFAYFFLYTSLTLSLQEIVIARVKGPKSYKSIARFCHRVSWTLFFLFLLVISTPLWKVWFYKVSGLTVDLGQLIPRSLLVLLPIPLVTGYISLYRGYLVSSHKTRVITIGVIVNAASLLTILFLGVTLLDIPAIYIATSAYSAAGILEALFLHIMKGRYPQ